MSLKYKLKYWSIIKKVTGKSLARISGVTEQTMSTYFQLNLKDKQSIPSDKLRLMAKALDLTMEELYAQPLKSQSDAKA